MAAIVAHEIKNPLGGIRGFASLLFRDLENTKHLQEMAGYILDGTKTLERLVNNVLHYSRPIEIKPKNDRMK
jgi:nitrogen-specific signal transduction histidine kinase